MEDMDLDDAIAVIKQRIIDLETMNEALEKSNKALKDTVLELVVEDNKRIQKFEADAWSEGYEAGSIDKRNAEPYPRKNPYRSASDTTNKLSEIIGAMPDLPEEDFDIAHDEEDIIDVEHEEVYTPPDYEVVHKTSLIREDGWLYYLDKDMNVARSRLRQGG